MNRVESDALHDDDLAVIAEETELLARVRAALEITAPRNVEPGTLAKMVSLRRELSEAGTDDLATLAAEAQRVRSTAAIQERVQRPNGDLPYFAHMQLESDRGLRDVLLGQCTFIDPKRRVTIVDWRAAPVAQVFFNYREGDDYEQEFPDRSVEGVVRKRRMLAFDQGELVQIQTPTCSYRRHGEDVWTRDAEAGRPTLEGGEGGAVVARTIGTGRSGLKLPVVSSLLDAKQYQALTADAERPLLIVGGAGCGKTTVALHRLAYLTYQRPEWYAPHRLLVIVPEEGLLRLTRSLLDGLGLQEVDVSTVDQWFSAQANRLFPELPEKRAVSTPASVIRLKRHPAFFLRLSALAEEAGQTCADEIDRALRTRGRFTKLYRCAVEKFPLARLESTFHRLVEELPQVAAQRPEFERILAKLKSPLADRERLLGDRNLIESVVRDSGGELPASVVDRSLERFRVQYAATTEETFAGVASHRRRALDGLALDAGTPAEDAGSIDVEDFALLLELHRLKTGRSHSSQASLPEYAHLVLDEAQELSQVELSVLGQTIADHGSITVAGDPVQQIGFGLQFRGWDAVMASLGLGRALPVTLETSYRCTAAIVDLGHAVLGPLAPEKAAVATRQGAPVSRSLVSNEMHAAILLGDALGDLLSREPIAQVAIIAREDETATRLYAALCAQIQVRLVLDGCFSFKPGIDITSVPHVKGLEFDYVIIPDADAIAYPDEPASRRMLHVAVTRAIHQLWLMSTNAWSPLLPSVP